MRSPRSGLTLTLVLLTAACGSAGCGSTVTGSGSPGIAEPVVAHSGADGRVEVTPLTRFDGTAPDGEKVLRLQVRLRNVGATVVQYFAGAESLVDGNGRAILSNPDDYGRPGTDPAYPSLPGSFALPPGQQAIGFYAFEIGSAQPVAFKYEPRVDWPLEEIPQGQPRPGQVPNPAGTAALNAPVTMEGEGQTGGASEWRPQKIQARVLRMVDPAPAGISSVGDGFRIVAAQVEVVNVGSNPFSAVPSASMSVFDGQGHGYDAGAAVLDYRVLFGGGVLRPGQRGSGLVGFVVPAKAKLTRVEFDVGNGGAKAVGRWAVG